MHSIDLILEYGYKCLLLKKKKKNKNFDAIRIKRINFPEFMIRENVEVIPFILILE